MLSDKWQYFRWEPSAHDTVHTILTDEYGREKMRYMLYDNPDDWMTFESLARQDQDLTENEKLLLTDYQSYTLRIECDIKFPKYETNTETSTAEVSFNEETGLPNYTTRLNSGCCLKDQSDQLGGGFCITFDYI